MTLKVRTRCRRSIQKPIGLEHLFQEVLFVANPLLIQWLTNRTTMRIDHERYLSLPNACLSQRLVSYLSCSKVRSNFFQNLSSPLLDSERAWTNYSSFILLLQKHFVTPGRLEWASAVLRDLAKSSTMDRVFPNRSIFRPEEGSQCFHRILYLQVGQWSLPCYSQE